MGSGTEEISNYDSKTGPMWSSKVQTSPCGDMHMHFERGTEMPHGMERFSCESVWLGWSLFIITHESDHIKTLLLFENGHPVWYKMLVKATEVVHREKISSNIKTK